MLENGQSPGSPCSSGCQPSGRKEHGESLVESSTNVIIYKCGVTQSRGRYFWQVGDIQIHTPCRKSLGIDYIYKSKGLWRRGEKRRVRRRGQRKRKERGERRERRKKGRR